jgi:hypothetical protein
MYVCNFILSTFLSNLMTSLYSLYRDKSVILEFEICLTEMYFHFARLHHIDINTLSFTICSLDRIVEESIVENPNSCRAL